MVTPSLSSPPRALETPGDTEITIESLADAFRDEAGVSLAVLVGSRARGDHREGSDVDLLIDLDPRTTDEVFELHDRLKERLGLTGIDISPISLRIAARSPRVWVKYVREGRVIIDGDGRWDWIRAAPEAARLASILPDEQMTPAELRAARQLAVGDELAEALQRQRRFEAEL